MELTSSENTDHTKKRIDSNNLDSKEASSGFSSEGPTHCERNMELMKQKGNIIGGREREGATSSKSCLSHGSISVIGRQRAMEDAMIVVPSVVDSNECGSYDFFGVYDGHGGARVAICCRDKMQKMLVAAVERNEQNVVEGGKRGLKYWDKVMKECFGNMDAEVLEGDAEMKSMGSTAAVVLVGEEEIVVANCGDSRMVLCRGGLAVPLSQDHKLPDRNDEREQVEAAGGQVLDWKGSRTIGVLATSRSIGDYYLKPYVISEPEVTVTNRDESDEFLIIATGGLWGVVSNEMACELLKKGKMGESNESRSAEAAAMLLELALARGSKDNISVIVIELKKPNPEQLN